MYAARRRMGRRLKWYGVALCSLIVANWLISAAAGGPRVRRFGNHAEFATDGIGLLFLWTRGTGSSIAWDCLPGPLPEFKVSQHRVFIVFPLWIPLIVVAPATAVLFWLESRRFKPGVCQECGYNLTGNISGVCPECGEPVPEEQANGFAVAEERA